MPSVASFKSRKSRRQFASLRLKKNSRHRQKVPEHPVETYAVLQQQLKGEDVLFVINDLKQHDPGRGDLGRWSVYAVCDGHGGSVAAKFVRKHLGSALSKVLPSGSPPPRNTPECAEFCQNVRHALVKVFVSLHDAFGSEGCRLSGTTLSVCLICDWLLTSANVADSEVFIDLGRTIMEMTHCHRVEGNDFELQRLQEGGADIRRMSSNSIGASLWGDEGRGPLRVWPGGIAMSRSIGDLECDSLIVPVPHIRQMWIPKEGTRMVIASDGLWDYVDGIRACRFIHSSPLSEAPKRLLRAARKASATGRLMDDISILVLDIMPQEGLDFTERRKVKRSNVLRSFRGYLHSPSLKKSLKKAPSSDLVADEDGLQAYPNMIENIIPEICDIHSTEVESDDDMHSRNASSVSENWDICESSWDCSVESFVSWERDDRDILDTAQSYITEHSSRLRSSGDLKMTLKKRVLRREDRIDSGREISKSHTFMTTIFEPENEETARM